MATVVLHKHTVCFDSTQTLYLLPLERERVTIKVWWDLNHVFSMI
jgi:hypothetical protein